MRWSVIFLILFALLCAGSNLCAETIILDSDKAKLFEEMAPYFYTPGQTEKLPDTGVIPEGAAVFKIVQVQNLQGNNPFNPLQPVFNFGGVLLANVDDLISCIRGGACPPGSQGGGGGGHTIICSPNQGDAPMGESVSTYIVNDICSVMKATGDTTYEALYVFWESAPWKVYAESGNVKYKMQVKPSTPCVMSGCPVNDETKTYSTDINLDGTNVIYRINFTVLNVGGKVRLTVTSVLKIP
jgi:hypothetical protein